MCQFRKSCVDWCQELRLLSGMDRLDKAREHMVEAMVCLEGALGDGLPAQAPSSDVDQVAGGIVAFRARVDEALGFVSRAEEALKLAERDGSYIPWLCENGANQFRMLVSE